ncbi:MAG: discoidin domain-containing protein [Clostridia bacterium]|nr:discoidin domain-containing protein [Clostridia bacterium]
MAKGIYVGAAVKGNNLVANGDFSSGLEGWTVQQTSYATSNIITENNEKVLQIKAINTGQSSIAGIQQVLPSLNAQHVYYLCAYIKLTSGVEGSEATTLCGISFNTFWQVGGKNVTSEWSFYGKRLNINSSYSFGDIAIGLYVQSLNDVAYFKNVQMYDLTEMFGTGNEPTQEWCDNNLDAVKANGIAHKVKKVYVGVDGERAVSEDIIPKTWETITTGTHYKTSNGIEISASGNYDAKETYYPYRACDGTTSAWTSNSATQHWIKLKFPKPEKITKFKMRFGGFTVSSYYSNAVMQGSKNGNDWTTLYTATTEFMNDLAEMTLNNTDFYNYYRLVLNCSPAASVFVQEWEVSEYVEQVSNIARKVKKGYIGVGGIARPFFSAEQKLEYYGTADSLSSARSHLAATSVGDYALFSGGKTSNSYSSTIDTYNSSLVKGSIGCGARSHLAATSVGDYALFGGGGANSSYYATVETYTSSLVEGTAKNLYSARSELAATTVGDYALFGGGSSSTHTSIVDVYTKSLSKSTEMYLSSARRNLAATSVGDYALFGGGQASSNVTATVDTYTSSLVKGTATSLSLARQKLAATTVGDYALFAGGRDHASGTRYDTVDTYTSSLVKGTATSLSESRQSLAATTVGDYALFGGGNNSYYRATVDVYNKSLAKSTTANLYYARGELAAATVGDYALFGGGTDNDERSTVDAYQVV